MKFNLPFFSRKAADVKTPEIGAAVVIPTGEMPKGKPGQKILPSYMKTAKPNPATALTRDERRLINTDITTLRTGADTPTTIRSFIKASPDLSAAVTAYTRTAVTNNFTAVAKNPDGTFNYEATSALHQIITRMNILTDPTLGFDDSMSIRSLCESWSKELMTYGAMAGELVLDKARLPEKIQPVSVGQIRLFPTADGKRLTPKQFVSGNEIDLNIPTFFMVSLDQDLLAAYPESPLESALQPVLFSAQFMNDIRRVVQKAIHPRMVVTIDEEKLRKNIPPDVAMEPDKLQEFLNGIIGGLQDQINGLEPHEALVIFDSITIEAKDHGNTNLSNEYTVLQGLADSKMATGAKVLPTVLGHSNGTSNVASAEVLMFMKYVEGGVWGKLNEMFSKMFTLAVRLLGQDVYVEFTLEPIELRPKSELESFKAMEQSRVLDQLSIGLITDEEACLKLTGKLPPVGYKKLSGTMFRAGAGSTQPAGDGYNGASNSGSTMNQNLTSTAPKGAKGGQKSAEVVPFSASQ